MTPSDIAFRRLQLAGWSLGETGRAGSWIVDGADGENQFVAVGRTQEEAWARACREAETLGMFGRSFV